MVKFSHCLPGRGCRVLYRHTISMLLVAVISLLAGLKTAIAEDANLGFIDSVHSNASQRLSDFIGQIDEFFGGEEETARANQTWLRLRVDPRYRDMEGGSVKGDLKLKVVLPNAKRRFRLLLSSDDAEERKPGDSAAQSSIDDGSNVSLALRFIRKARENGSVKFDLGVRSRDGKNQSFVRLGAFHRQPLGQFWTGTITNNAFYYYSSGFEDKLTFKLERPIGNSENWIFQTSALFGWKEHQKGAVADQVTGVYRAFGNRSSLAFELLTQAYTSREPGSRRFRRGELLLRYRQNIWRPWLYFELWPSVSWPSEHGYKGLPGILLRLEALIGRDDKV